MEIPRFFSEPHFKKEIDFMNLNKTLDHDIFLLYDSTKVPGIGKIKIMSIKASYKYYIILYRGARSGKLDGPCILSDSDIDDLGNYDTNFYFSGIVLAKIDVYKLKFETVPRNIEITSQQIEKLLNNLPVQTPSYWKWLTNIFYESKMNIEECDKYIDEKDKYICYYETYKSMYDECVNRAKQLEQINNKQLTMLDKKEKKLKQTQKQLKDTSIILCLFMILVLLKLLYDETRMTYVKMYLYSIPIGCLFIYLMYLVWFT